MNCWVWSDWSMCDMKRYIACSYCRKCGFINCEWIIYNRMVLLNTRFKMRVSAGTAIAKRQQRFCPTVSCLFIIPLLAPKRNSVHWLQPHTKRKSAYNPSVSAGSQSAMNAFREMATNRNFVKQTIRDHKVFCACTQVYCYWYKQWDEFFFLFIRYSFVHLSIMSLCLNQKKKK